jgi:hypothetical protein
MNGTRKLIRDLGIMILCAFALCSCSQTRSVRTSIYGDHHQEILLQKDLDSDGISMAKGYSHPAEFEITDMKYLLRSINYQEKRLFGWSDSERVFAADEIYRLAPHLVEAFTGATPDDDVVFSSKSVKGGAIFSSECLTDGKMFVKGNKLNCLFGNINIKLSGTEKYEGDPIKEYAGVFVRLAAKDSQTLVDGPKGIHYNWIELDYEALLAQKKRAEEALKRRRNRIRAIRKRKEFRETGWEDWKAGDAVKEEIKPAEEDNVVWPSESP